MRMAVVDIGTNSTRLLLADVDPATGAVKEIDRRSQVTRLGDGVDASGALAQDARRASTTRSRTTGRRSKHGRARQSP